MNKKCKKCNTEKPIIEFYKDKKNKDNLNRYCKKCCNEFCKNDYVNNKEKYKNRHYYYNSINKDKLSKQHKNYYIKNKEGFRRNSQLYFKNNKEHIIEKRKEYPSCQRKYYNNWRRKNRKINIDYKLENKLRTRLINGLKNNIKSDRTLNLLGCSIVNLKEHLQQTAISNSYNDFNINNYSGKDYHIDHIIPCSAFNLKCSYHQKLCFNWENMQILEAKENLSKGNKLEI